MKMNERLSRVTLLVLLFCMYVRCGVFDDEATVRKARCYANCVTMVSNILINDSSCLSSQCLECKIPCDRNFDSVENCTKDCPNASIYCNQSCTFLGVTKNWTNIYQGNGKTIGKPGVVNNTSRNVTTLTLSWQPPINASGTVVYLLKEKMTGDKKLATPTPLKGLVFLEPRAILTAKDACSVQPTDWRSTYGGISFAFSVVALTEVSLLAEGQQSSLIDFQKAEPIPLYNASMFYNPNAFANKLEFRVYFTPSTSSSFVIKYIGKIRKTGGECKAVEVEESPRKESNSLLSIFTEKLKTCNISFTAYSVTECLPSKPKTIEYYYKGCHYLPSMNTSFCCTFEPLPTPESAKEVRNLSHSLQYQSDFRFTANIMWLPPTQPCPVAASYRLYYYIFHPFWKNFPQVQSTVVNHYSMTNIEPNLVRNITVTPFFGGDFRDLGVGKVISIQTPGFPPNETIITNIQHDLKWPTLPSERLSLTISWVKPKFNYSRINGYNVTYKVLGDVTKQQATQQLWYQVRGLDLAQTVYYEVLPVYRDPWIQTKATARTVTLPGLPLSETMARNLQYHLQMPMSPAHRFTLNISWLEPKFNHTRIKEYNVTYTVQGDLTKHNTTQQFWYQVRGLDYTQKVSFEVLPVFYHSWIPTKATARTVTLPGLPLSDTVVRNLNYQLQRPMSPAHRFTLNISWLEPKFSYTRIKEYNVTYTVQGDVTKHNTTEQFWYQVRGLDYTQKVSFEVSPVYRDLWVQTKAVKRRASLPVLRNEELMIRGLNHSFFQANNFYGLLVHWSPPSFQRNVSYYKVSYKLTGNAGNEPDCPSKPSSNRTCLPGKTTNTSYTISNIYHNERIELKVTPVFENTQAFEGKTKTLIAHAPAKGPATIPRVGKPWSSGEIALLVVGILVFLAILVLLLLFYLRWQEKKNVENGKIGRHKGVIIDHWEVSHNNLDLIEVIGEGAFGKVYKGMLLDSPEHSRSGSSSVSFGRRSVRSTRSSRGDDPYIVAVKMLHDSADDDQRKEFLKEIQLMKDIGSHRNIVNMLGCGTIRDPMFLVVEYLSNGDLLHYLRKRRGKAKDYPESDSRGPNHSTYCQAYFNMNGKPRTEANLKPANRGFYVNTNDGFQADSEDGGIQLVAVNKISGKEPFTPSSHLTSLEDDELDDEVVTSGDLMAFAWQVAQGMEYLSKRGYVHRDLAARNVLVGNSKEAKVADFGLTRHTYEYLYRAKTNRRLPLKWMSIEAIFDQTFTSQSDVWAFGVLLWEIVTLGGTPYPAKTNRELLNFLKEGRRMEKPDTCDDEVYGIMMSCWKEKPEERPTFVQIREKFEEMMMRENPYFDPSSVDESRDYYNVPSFNSIEESGEGDDDVFNDFPGIRKENEMENQRNGNAFSDREERLSEQEKHEEEFNEKELDIGDIETLLYRKQHHSVKQKPSA